jgi:acyl-coenzyme A synthetase/AMP-(fatty) acid ligase
MDQCARNVLTTRIFSFSHFRQWLEDSSPWSMKSRTLVNPHRAINMPRPLYLVDALPRTANGKITRGGLEALARSVSPRRHPGEPSPR